MKVILPSADEGKKTPSSYLKKEVIHLPFYLFAAHYSTGRKLLYMVDALRGKTLRISDSLLRQAREAREDFPAKISPSRAREILMPEARFPLSLFFKARLMRLEFLERVLYPFIVYYRRKNSGYSLDVFDGVTGKKENLFAREMIIDFILNQTGEIQ